LIIKRFNEVVKAKRQTQTEKLTNLLFSLQHIYIGSLYCFNQSLFCFSLEKSGCLWKQQVVGWLWKEPVTVIDLDLHYRHEAV